MTEEHSISLQPGTVLGGKYEVVKSLGKGSMGVVYACRHRMLQGQLVAVKVLYPDVARDKVAAARFENEVLASYKVSHSNVVRAYDYLTERDLVAYTMEYVGGGDLHDRLNDSEKLSIKEIVKLLSQMAAGCQAIHDAGIVHRDLKPENILLTSQGDVKIADFGIARNRNGPKLTEHGGVLGTLDYLAPEYILKSQVDWRSDIYALGILAYEMLTGIHPFKEDNVYAAMTMRLKTDPSPPSALRPECPPELDRIVLKAMQRDPENRYQSASDMFHDLQILCDRLGISPVESGSVPTVHEVESALPQSRPSVVLDSEEVRELRELIGLDQPGSGIPSGGETQGLEPPMEDYSIETDSNTSSPYVAPEPLITSFRNEEIVSEGPQYQKPTPAFRAPRSKDSNHRVRQQSTVSSYVGETIAIVFAAGVGIGLGLMFLQFFAPWLLIKIWPW